MTVAIFKPSSGASVSFGTTTQIPYMNASGDDFLYSSSLTFDGTVLTTKKLGLTLLGPTDITALTIQQAYGLTAENAKLIDVDRTLARITTGPQIIRSEVWYDFYTIITDNDSPTASKSNSILYVGNQFQMARAQVLAGSKSTNILYKPFVASVYDSTGLTITNSSSVNEKVYGFYSDMSGQTTLNNSSLIYTREVFGLYFYFSTNLINTSSSSKTDSMYGVYVVANSPTYAADVGYGGYFKATGNTANYGLYSEGATAALYAKGHIIFYSDDTYDIGASGGNWLSEIYQKGIHYFRDTAISIQSATDGHLDLTADVSVDVNSDLDVSSKNIITDTSTGTRIGTATTQKLAFYNSAPVVQPAAVADATGAGDVVAQLNALLARIRSLGLIAT